MPKRFNHLYPRIHDFKHLLFCANAARKGTGWTHETSHFYFHLERQLLSLKDELESETYLPGAYRYFSILDPKPRMIAVAPFRDRVVHHALVDLLTPIYEPRFIDDSYATRVDKGTHKAVLRCQHFLKRSPFYLKTDIRKFFDSVDHQVLLKLLEHRIKDKQLLLLIEKIIFNVSNTGKGLPIGNLTSQFWANVYLDPLDHYVKEVLQIKGYVRYMDDFVIFSQTGRVLNGLLDAIENFLEGQLKLRLHLGNTWLNTANHGLSFIGMRIWPHYIRTRSENWRRSQKKMHRRIKEFEQGKLNDDQISQSLQSIVGYHQRFKSSDNLLK
ncbi:MAG: hypothetical protein HON94_06940 [Methylococcales bacterium]|nr:hypothetical protein [Methylococcales bacterium]MBT7409408.1 hypothetical protein [Methylococcales bacterium]